MQSDKQYKCLGRMWALEHLIGYQIIYSDSIRENFFHQKKLKNILSVNDCGQLCLNESNFVCRSAQYNATSGDCQLANMNRHTIDGTHIDRTDVAISKSNRIRFARTDPFSEDIHYIENNCIEGNFGTLKFRILTQNFNIIPFCMFCV